jgi:hypothetical protein
MVHTHRTARKSTGHQPTGQLAPRDVPPQQEPQPDSAQEEEPFEIVVTVLVGEDSQETQPMPQNHDQQEEEDNEKEEDDNKAEGEEDNDYTPWSIAEKDEIFHDADEIKTFVDEAPIPTGRLRDLLKHINITTPPEFRIKRIPRPGQEEYKAIVEIISGPNVLSRHKGPAFRTTYPDVVADAAWQEHRLPLATTEEEKPIHGFWGQGRCSQDAYGASPGCVCEDEHPSADCPAGDSETPRLAQRLRCDD